MQDQWLFKSETYDNCNCAVNCGCQFQLPSTYGLLPDGLRRYDRRRALQRHAARRPELGGPFMWPGEIAEGDGKRLIVIDERADETQRIALETIISGEACAPMSNLFSVFGSLCSESFETLFLPIDLEVNFELRTARVNIPAVMKSSGTTDDQ